MPINDVFVQNSSANGSPFEANGITDLTTIGDLTVQVVNLGRDVTNGAAYGETIDTSADIGNSLDVSDYTRIQLVFRDSSTEAQLFKSAPLDVSTMEVSDLTYQAPTQQVTSVGIPAPSADDFWTVKITNVESGAQPFEPRSYEVEVLSSDSASDVIVKFIDSINSREDSINGFLGSTVYAGDDQEATITIDTFNGGDDFTLTIDGTDYTTNALIDEDTTFETFVDTHADTIFETHGVRVTQQNPSSGDLVLNMVNGSLTLTDAGDLDVSTTGTLAVTLTDSPTRTELRLEAKEVGDIFDVAVQEFNSTSETTSSNPTIGQGTYQQVKTAEEQSRGSLGRYVQSTNLLGSLPEPNVYAQTDGQYRLLNVSCENDYDKGMNRSFKTLTYIVAIESGATSTDTNSNSEDDYIDWFAPKIVASG